MDKLRKRCVAELLSFFTVGLGHIYAGKAKKGIVLYALCLAGFSMMIATFGDNKRKSSESLLVMGA